jgi:hypothetical protein
VGCLLIAATADADVVVGNDFFRTVEGPGSHCDITVPSDFFGPGSDPFDPPPAVSGNPDVLPQPDSLGADTKCGHSAYLFGLEGGDLTKPYTTWTLGEKVEKVTVTPPPPDFPAESFFDVFYSLQATPESIGQMRLVETDAEGGVIKAGDTFLELHVRMDWYNSEGGDPLTYEFDDVLYLSADVPWSYTPADGMIVHPEAGNFFPGVTPGDPTAPLTTLQFDGTYLHLELELVPEPATAILLAAGAVALLRKRRR